MNLTFIDYAVTDNGVEMRFLADNPGAGNPSYYTILITDAEIAGISTAPQLRTLVTTKLNRKLRATGFATKLDPFIGQSVTI